MQNKNKHNKINKFDKLFDSNFFESKFLFITTEPEADNVEPTPTETGQLEAESIVNRFDQRYSPEQIPYSGNSPDEVIYGVRNQMMEGPFNNFNVMSGGEILDRRVRRRLDYIRHNAPRYYKHIIDEEVRRRAGRPQTWRYRVANIMSGYLFRREWAEREVARDFFTYEHIRGGNYNTLATNLENQISALGVIGGPAFVDSRGNAINLGQPNPVNEFDVAVGTSGVPTHETVVINWNEEDFITIRRKLERANMWADFSRQQGAREFIHLKFRLSQLREVINEEKAKLSADRFNPQRLKDFLNQEAMTHALRDDVFINWVNDNVPAGIRSMNALQSYNPALYRELIRQQKEAKERVRNKTLEQMLQDILTQKQLENVHTSVDTKAMLAYLEAGVSDPGEGSEVKEYIKSLSGRGQRLDTLIEKDAEWKNNLYAIEKVLSSFNVKFPELSRTREDIRDLTIEINALSNRRPTQDVMARIEKLTNERRKAREKEGQLQREIVDSVWNVKEFIKKYANTPPYKDNIASILSGGANSVLVDPPNHDFLNHPNLSNKPSTAREINVFLNTFSEYFGNTHFLDTLDKLKKQAQETKTNVENELKAAKESEGKAEKMDSRGLLYKLIERDLRLKGVTEETGLQQKALYATNMIITKARHTEIYGATNKRLVAQSGGLRRRLRNVAGAVLPQDWLPVLSAKDVLQHVVDTDPDLALFHDISVFSSRSDFIKAMQRFGKVSPKKLREMQMKLAEFIKGIEVPTKKGLGEKARQLGRKTVDLTQLENIIAPTGKRIVPGKTYTLRAEEAPMIENMIHILSLLETEVKTENFLEEVREDESIDPERDRAKLILKKLEMDSQTDANMDNAIASTVKDHESDFKTRLLFNEQKRRFNEAMNEVEGLPEEDKIEQLERLGMNARQRSKGILSLRTRRVLKKAGKGFLKYGPHSWPFWALAGVGYGGYKAYKGYMNLFKEDLYKKAKATEKMDWAAFARAPGNLVGSVFNIGKRIVLWPTSKLDTKVRRGVEKYHAKRSAET